LAYFLEQVQGIVPISLPWHKKFLYQVKGLFERHIGWRLKKL
jgi:hypothetical protein